MATLIEVTGRTGNVFHVVFSYYLPANSLQYAIPTDGEPQGLEPAPAAIAAFKAGTMIQENADVPLEEGQTPADVAPEMEALYTTKKAARFAELLKDRKYRGATWDGSSWTLP